MSLLQEIAATIGMVREKQPLIHHVTNYVTVNDCANITLAIGASPIMASDVNEMEDVIALAGALVINIGTLDSITINAMLLAGQKASKRGIPVVLDPVGAGATRLRTTTAQQIIAAVNPTVIRGNMSEIMTLAGLQGKTRGVDSAVDEWGAAKIAQDLAGKLDCVVVITGKTDTVACKDSICRVHNGHVMMTGVTGTGCMSTSLIGSCCAVQQDAFIGAAAGITAMGIAGEIAQKTLKNEEGLGTYRVRLLDAVSHMMPDTILNNGKIS